MTLTVRLPLHVEEKLATYCVERGATKSAVVQSLIEDLLGRQAESEAHPLVGQPFVGCDEGTGEDVSGNVKAILRQRFRVAVE
jgi:Arc/MetJ-type ribon-helix-helix transcriptional regulator